MGCVPCLESSTIFFPLKKFKRTAINFFLCFPRPHPWFLCAFLCQKISGILRDFPPLFCAFLGRFAGLNFYVSLTMSLSPAAAEKRFRGTEMYIVATGIGSVATGILGVFPACTSRRRYMYIFEPRNLLIVSTTKEGVRTRCISPLFSTQR